MANELPLVSAIQWYEGMLLSPQHFQQLELRWEQTSSQYLMQLSPYHWGIIKLAFDPVPLPTGILRILELRAIMPDGLVVEFLAKPNAEQLEIDLTSQRDVLHSSDLSVYLCVPEYTKGSSPVIGEWPRYDSVEGHEISDDNVADNVIQIPRLLPKLSLHLGDHPPARFQSFPIAKVDYQDETYVLKTFMPPCFQISQLSPLGERCGQLIRRMREKSAYLSEKWQTLIGTPLLSEASAQLRPLLQSLPLMEPLIMSGRAHPYELFRNMAQISGYLSTLRLGQIPPLFPIYNHNDILGCTMPFIEWCRTIIDSLEKAYSIVLFVHRDQAYSVMLQPQIFTKRLLIGIKSPPGMSEDELEDWMKSAIIVSESMLESVRMRRITGTKRQLITKSELYDLMPGRGVLIFSIETDDVFIKSGERLILFNPADTEDKRPLEAVLYLRHSELSGDVIDHLDDEE